MRPIWPVATGCGPQITSGYAQTWAKRRTLVEAPRAHCWWIFGALFLAHAIGPHGFLRRWLYRGTHVPVAVEKETAGRDGALLDDGIGAVVPVRHEREDALAAEGLQHVLSGYWVTKRSWEAWARGGRVLRRGNCCYRRDTQRRDPDGCLFLLNAKATGV